MGRYLAANGVLPLKRDRLRGSLYGKAEVRQQLAQDPPPQAVEHFLAGLHLVAWKPEPAAAAAAIPVTAGTENKPEQASAASEPVSVERPAPAAAKSRKFSPASTSETPPASAYPAAAAQASTGKASPSGNTPPVPGAAVAGVTPPMVAGWGLPPGMPPPGWVPLVPANALPPYASGLMPATPASGFYENMLEPAEPARRELPLAFYGQQIRRHWIKVLAAALLVTVLVGIHMRLIPKEYGSTATVRISAMLAGNSGLVNSGYSGDYLDNLQTLMATIMSDVVTPSVVDAAVRVGKLARDPSIVPSSAHYSREALARLVGGSVSVNAVPGTRNFQITAVAGNPVAAANIANAMAKGLIEHEYQTRLNAITKSNEWMHTQLLALKAKLELSQKALVDYQHQKALLNPTDQDALMQQSMQLINQQLSAIQVERFRYQADLAVVKGNSLPALLTTSIANSTIGHSLADALTAQQKAETNFDAVEMYAGPANPAYIQAQQQLQVANRQLQRMRQEATAQIQMLYEKARDQETLLRQALNSGQLKQRDFNASTLDYNLLHQDVNNNRQLYNDLQQQFNAANLSASFHGEMLRIVNPATPNGAPVYPNVRREVILAFLMSLLGGCVLAVGIGYLDRSLKTPEDVAHLGANFLGSLPLSLEAISVRNTFSGSSRDGEAAAPSVFEEAVLSLRTAIMLAPGASEARTFTITSSTPGEGKSTILAHMAIAMSMHGVKTLLLDAELRRPQIHRMLDVPNRQGVSEILRGVAEPGECILPTAINNLWVLPSGGRVANPSQLLHTGLSGLLEQLKKDYQIIFIDTPPLLGFSETLLVDSLVDMVMVVVLAGKNKREQVHAMLQQLRRVRANVIGVVLNQVVQSMSPYYSHYGGSYYTYSHEDAHEENL